MSKIICLDISVLNDKNRTGVGVYTYQLIKALLKNNKKDKFILFGFATFQTYDYLRNIEFKNYPNVSLKIYKMPAKLFRTSFLLWQKMNWPKIENFVGLIDIFHSFNWNLPPVKNAKLVATVFDMTPILFPKYHLEKTIQLDKVRLNRIKRYADLVITISENSKKDFLKFAPNRKVEVIYPGVSDNFLKKINKKKTEQILKKYNLQSGYVLSVGTLEPRKNIERIIQAFTELASQGQALRGCKLVIVGRRGWLADNIYKLPEKLGIKNKVKFLGRVEDEDLPYLYNQASCLIYPSLYEGFGIPVLEAQASGCPVITSDTSSLPEVGGDAVLYIDPNSSGNLISALERIKNQEFRIKLIKKGLEQAKKFSWEKSAKKLNSLYQQL